MHRRLNPGRRRIYTGNPENLSLIAGFLVAALPLLARAMPG
jgi:hypothetical protein